MNQRIQILNTKLTPPRASGIIIRERLNSLLKEIPKRRVTALTAGAGYGKTTLIANIYMHGLDVAWYRIDMSDRDIIPFIAYLVAGIQKHSSLE